MVMNIWDPLRRDMQRINRALGAKPPGLARMTFEQRAQLVRMYGEAVVRRAESEQAGKGYGAIAIACEEVASRPTHRIWGNP